MRRRREVIALRLGNNAGHSGILGDLLGKLLLLLGLAGQMLVRVTAGIRSHRVIAQVLISKDSRTGSRRTRSPDSGVLTRGGRGEQHKVLLLRMRWDSRRLS